MPRIVNKILNLFVNQKLYTDDFFVVIITLPSPTQIVHRVPPRNFDVRRFGWTLKVSRGH